MLILSASPARAASAAVDEVRAAMAAGDWKGAASRADKALFPTPADATERYELLMLKGECRLQLRDSIGAGSAFKSAAKSAGDVNQHAAAIANALVVDRSTGGKFRRRDVASAQAIDIVPPESRKQAMIELRDEMWRQYSSQIEAAMHANQLPPIERIFTRVAEMYLLELCATGRADDVGKQARELGQHAFNLMRDEVRKSDVRLDQLSQIANSSGTNAVGWDSGRLGLTSQQRDEVKRMIPYLVKIRDRASEYRQIAARLGGEPDKWDTLVADTVAVAAEAEGLFNDR